MCQKNATNAKEDEGVTTGAPSIESNLTTPSPVIEEGAADEGATTIPSAQMPDDSIVVEDPELLQETEEEDSEGSGSEEGQQEEEDVDEDIHELEVAGKARREAAGTNPTLSDFGPGPKDGDNFVPALKDIFCYRGLR